MSATLISINNDEAVFQIRIDADTFEKALMDEYKKADSKGKPSNALLSNKAALEQYPQLQKIINSALEKLMPTYYTLAIKKLKLKPLTFPKFTPRAMGIGQPCLIDVHVSLEPTIELKQIEGLEVSYTPVIVTDGDIDRQIAGLRKQHEAEGNDAKLLEKLSLDSMAALHAEIRQSLETMATERSDLYRKEAVIKQLIAANPITLKEAVIDQQITLEINQTASMMGQQALQSYMQSTKRTMSDLRKEVRPQAEATAKKNLLLGAIADKISPEITDDDINAAISKHPGSFMDFALDPQERRRRFEQTPGALDQVTHLIRTEKASDYIVSKAVFREEAPISILESLPEYMREM